MRNKDLVKIRKEKKQYFCYFIDLRKIVIVNEIGARIIDLFFNKNYTIPKIIKDLSTNLGGSKTRTQIDFKNKINEFLKEIRTDLKNKNQGGFPFIQQQQMDVPLVAELQVNTRCNLRCKHCCQSNYDRIMSFSKIKEFLNILYKEGIFEINIVGGEAFLHPNILEIISLCCEKYNFATNIITNATLLSSRIIKNLSRFKNNLAFLVSIEGVGNYNDEIRGKGTFKKIDKSIRDIKKNGIYLETSTTINTLTIKHWENIVAYAKKLNIPCNFNLFKLFKDSQKNLVLDPKTYFEFIEKVFDYRRRMGANIGITNAAIVAELNRSNPRNECRATLSGLTINVQGKMIPCPFLNEAGYYKNKNLPNFDKKFKNQWKNNRWFKDFRKGNLKECQACSYIFCGDKNKINPYGLVAFKKYLRTQ